MNNKLAKSIAEALGWPDGEVEFRAVSGGSIAGSWRLESADRQVFIKTMPAPKAPMLDAERDGLERLAGAKAIRTPSVLAHGRLGDNAWLALEWLEIRPLDGKGFTLLGRQLSELHRNCATHFGLDRDNFIGVTRQPNSQTEDWTEFLFKHRLGFQLDLLAADRGDIDADLQHRLRDAWHCHFPDYRPEPSLLHGDLWGGNAGMLVDGRPVVFDPAVHYGDRECDLAMADLFGGFGAEFFDEYTEHWPLEPGWDGRRPYYKLYHLLNHANLFGGHYVSASKQLIDELVA